MAEDGQKEFIVSTFTMMQWFIFSIPSSENKKYVTKTYWVRCGEENSRLSVGKRIHKEINSLSCTFQHARTHERAHTHTQLSLTYFSSYKTSTVQWFPKCGLREHFLEDPCIHFCNNSISKRKIYCSEYLSKVNWKKNL